MNVSQSFERMDLYKLIVFVVLLVILIVLVMIAWRDTAQDISGGSQAATATSDMGLAGAESETPATEVAVIDSTPVSGEQGEAPEEGVPTLPESSVVLTYDSTEGLLITPDGQAVYGLSVDGTLWVPIVPGDLAEELGTPAPEIDADGNWIVISVDRSEMYHWDEASLTWVKSEDVPPDTAPTEIAQAEATSTQPPEAEAGETEEQEATATEDAGSGAPTGTEEAAAGPDSGDGSDSPNLPVPPPPDTPSTYKLQSGEFVYCIARRFDVNPNQLLKMNGLTYSSVVYRGMRLSIPQGGGPFPGNPSLKDHPTWHTVKKGDTINSIACEYGNVYPYAIAYANNLNEPYKLSPGQELYIP